MKLINLQVRAFAYNRAKMKNLPKCYKDREIKPMKYSRLVDPLYYNEAQDKVHNIIEQSAERLASPTNPPASIEGLAHLMYNSAKKGFNHEQMYINIDTKLPYLKGEFNKRLVFGCLYGVLRSNMASVFSYDFFMSELKNSFVLLKYQELVELFEAASYNTNLDKVEIDQLMMVIVYDSLMKHKKKIQHDDNLIISMIEALDRRNLYPGKDDHLYKGFEQIGHNIEEMWEMLLTSFGKQNRIKANDRMIKNYELFYKLESEQRLHRSIEPELKVQRERMEKKVDLLWRYNIEERRLYTYKELKARRNNYSYVADEDAPWQKQQWLSMYEPCQVEILKGWRKERMVEQGLIKQDKEIKDLEEELDDLIEKTYKQKVSQKYESDDHDSDDDYSDEDYSDENYSNEDQLDAAQIDYQNDQHSYTNESQESYEETYEESQEDDTNNKPTHKKKNKRGRRK